MKFSIETTKTDKNILANDHYVGIPYDCSEITGTDGIIPVGTVIPSNDDKAVGVLLSNVVLAENPNGTIVVHGFIDTAKLPAEVSSAAKTALNMIKFI